MNEFLARNGLIALDSSSIFGPLTVSGSILLSGSLRSTADTLLIGSGNTSATNALLVQNSDGVNILRVGNDRTVTIGLAGGAVVVNTNSVTLDRTTFQVVRDGVNPNFFVSNIFGSNASGIYNVISTPTNYQPTTGNAVYNTFVVNPTVSQSNASGITRGIYVNPTLTSAWDFRAIEWTNNASSTSGSWGLYGSGSAPNYLSGSLSIGTTGSITPLYVRSNAAVSSVLTLEAGSSQIAFSFNGSRSGFTYPGNHGAFFSPIFGFTGNNVQIGIGNGDAAARLHVRGESASIGTALLIQNSTPSNLLTVLNNGNVGIAVSSPSEVLQIKGNLRVQTVSAPDSAGTASIILNPEVNTPATIQALSNFGPTSGTNYSTGFKFITSNRDASLPNPYYSVDAMSILANGNIGIGTTTDTSAKLHISGSTGALLRVGSNASSNILFVSSSGNIGIGTSSPIAALDVNGTITSQTFITTNANIDKISVSIPSAGDYRIRGFSYGGTLRISAAYLDNGGQIILYGNTHSSNAGNIYMTNRVGINTASPTYGLDVNGSFRVTGSITATSGSDYFDISHDITQPAQTGSQIYEVNITPTLRYTAPNQTQTALRVAATFSGSTALSSSQSNIIADFGSTSAGSQLVVNDITSGSIYMVNDVSGIPIIEANSNWDVFIYDYPNVVLRKTGSAIIISGSLTNTGSFGSAVLNANNSQAMLVVSGSNTIGGANYIDFLKITNSATSAINPNKTLRLNVSGALEIINSSYTGNLFTLTEQGDINLSGSLTMPSRPAFRVWGNGSGIASTTVLSGSNTVVDYNQGNAWNNTTGTFTAPIAGLYQVNIVGRTATNNNSGINQILVRKTAAIGGGQTTQIMLEWAANTSVNHIGGSSVTKLAVGDTLQAIVTAGTISFDGNNNFSVAYIG